MKKRYPKYKPSGVEWIGEIPEHWEISRLKLLATDGKSSFIDGDWIESKDITAAGIRYITTGNIGSGVFRDQGNSFISEETFSKLNCTELFPGDLVLSRLFSPIGRSCILPDLGHRVVTSVDNVIYRPNERCFKPFLNYYFNWKRYNEASDLLARGTTLERISRSMLGNNPVLLPPIEEQKAIAMYLDQKTTLIDRTTQKKQRLIELLQEERTALINQAVTRGLNPDVKLKPSGVEWLGDVPGHWETKRVKHISNTISKGTTPSTEGREVSAAGTIRFIKAENISNDAVVSEPAFFIDDETNEILKRSKLHENDILIVIAGATIGKVAILPWDFVPANTNQAVCFIRLSSGNHRFVWRCLQSSLFKEFIKRTSVQSAQPNLSMENIGNFVLPYPPVSEQSEIVDFIDKHSNQIYQTIERVQKEIRLLQEYRTALINEVVTGKRCVIEVVESSDFLSSISKETDLLEHILST